MENSKVGAGILSIITESLYDNPIVVFREYVQNSMDSIYKKEDSVDGCEIRIWDSNDNLFFLDNGVGIDVEKFKIEMLKIGASTKKRQRNLGYKGIGRLSGVPYCKKLFFINICDYATKKMQFFEIDGDKYESIKKSDKYSQLSFDKLMNIIGDFGDGENITEFDIWNLVEKYDEILKYSNTGFLVILQDIKNVLKAVISDESFIDQLQWLLPLNFRKELYDSPQGELFTELTSNSVQQAIPVRHCRIFYKDNQLFRPICKEMLRDYVCKSNLKYAVGFHTFKGDRILIDKKNDFSGIRIYIDNMLLCDENEIIQNLEHYGLLMHTSNGQLQSVKGIGAMIYITDKVNISANARRTFIEVTDDDSIEFLKMLAEFVNTVYDTRYALSNYASAKFKQQEGEEKIQKLRDIALENLKKLAKEDISLVDDDEENTFEELSATEKKKMIKSKISQEVNLKLREYIKQLNEYNLASAYEDFMQWLKETNDKNN